MFGGLPGTEGARKAAVVDGCCIIKVEKKLIKEIPTLQIALPSPPCMCI